MTSEVSGPLPTPPTSGRLPEMDVSKLRDELLAGPLTQPTPPSEVNAEAAQKQMISQDTIDLDEAPPAENAEKSKSLTEKIISFAQEHPFLTAGIGLAILMSIATGYAGWQALHGVYTIHVGNVNIPLSGTLIFMYISYTVSLIIICREATVKDTTMERLRTRDKLFEQLEKASDPRKTRKKMTEESQQLQEDLGLSQAAFETKKEKLKKEYNEAVLNHAQFLKLNEGMRQLYRERATEMQQAARKEFETVSDSIVVAIDKGRQLVAPQFEEFEPPSIVVPTTITIQDRPDIHPIEEDSFKKSVSKMLSTAIKNPGTRALALGALSMFALSGVALFFYFHGASSIYFFGNLTTQDMFTMLAAGGSLVAAAYFNTSIAYRREQLKRIEQEQENWETVFREEREAAEKLEKEKQETQTFRDALATFKTKSSETTARYAEKLKAVDVASNKMLQQQAQTLLRFAASQLYGEEVPKELTSLFTALAEGAKSVAVKS